MLFSTDIPYTVEKMHPILDAKCNETKFSMQFH
jgi:hypothetical protein